MNTPRGRLDFNPEPLKVVSVRRGETRATVGWRCDHEDGRGRCTSRDTRGLWNAEARRAEHYCAKHWAGTEGDTE